MTTERNHDYTVSCRDGAGRTLEFRDITGNDLEFLDKLLVTDENEDPQPLWSGKVIDLLDMLCITDRVRFGRFTSKTIRALYSSVSEHILTSYMRKEDWLRQCYSIQNGSFQNLADMESVPMSKFVAMCAIHKEAMDQINNSNPTNDITPAPVH